MILFPTWLNMFFFPCVLYLFLLNSQTLFGDKTTKDYKTEDVKGFYWQNEHNRETDQTYDIYSCICSKITRDMETAPRNYHLDHLLVIESLPQRAV